MKRMILPYAAFLLGLVAVGFGARRDFSGARAIEHTGAFLACLGFVMGEERGYERGRERGRAEQRLQR